MPQEGLLPDRMAARGGGWEEASCLHPGARCFSEVLSKPFRMRNSIFWFTAPPICTVIHNRRGTQPRVLRYSRTDSTASLSMLVLAASV